MSGSTDERAGGDWMTGKHIDDGTAAEQEDEDEGPMNSKSGGFGQAVLAGVIVAAAGLAFSRVTDSTSATSTATSIATLTVQVANLSEQVKKLTEQPYVRRDEYAAGNAAIENRISGLDGRLNQLEQRDSGPGRARRSP